MRPIGKPINGRQYYVVTHHRQEFACRCGEPVYVGDRAVHDHQVDEVFCSSTCSDEARQRAPGAQWGLIPRS